MQQFDYIVIGGGIFGCYAALFLAEKGGKVALIEKENHLFQKASLVNQARLHSGYHYPRSVATAAMSDEHKERFTLEHKAFVHTSFEKFYAIDRFGSFTDPQQFERFCAYLNIPCKKLDEHPLFNFDRLEALYQTVEHSFDPVLIGNYYREKIEKERNIQLQLHTKIERATTAANQWELELIDVLDGALKSQISAPVVINATYAATNSLNQLFGLPSLALTHEISEIGFITSKAFANKGLTVMDGPFGSIMPYGLSGILSLSSVAYTHHKISYEALPHFDCQQISDPTCTPQAPGICTNCERRPDSNAGKMLAQMRQYFSEKVEFDYLFSYFTIKSKLQSSHIDDGRPTEISLLSTHPKYYCLFAGKINSIYEVEKILED
ncbi:MAG: FAD-binding oxidoreductase [Saprospiraceae bacterium]|nr:FAD-binding oxidoreductase [Saprospiraceae bacterium]